MKLNHKGFFAQKILWVTEYDYPRTICDLVTRLAIVGLVFTVLGSVALYILACFSITAFGLIAVALGHLNWSDLFIGEFDRAALIMTTAVTAALLAIGLFITAKHFITEAIKRKRNLAKTDPNYVAPEPNPIVSLAVGMWDRIKDKTCTVIEYENDPREIRRREDEEYRLIRERAWEALKARQEAEAESNKTA
jgi:hypothetical protein